MFRRSTDLSWLGAEALPGDLAEINRVNQAWLDAAIRRQRYVKELRRRGFAATAIHWTKERLFGVKSEFKELRPSKGGWQVRRKAAGGNS